MSEVSYLKEKVEFNKSAAQLLYEQSYYAPSVHCAYYSCFQLLKILIKEKLHIDYNQQESEILKTTNLGTHIYVQNKILKEISDLEKNTDKFREIRTKLVDLRELRVKADYKNIQIDESKGRMALHYSEELKIYFKEKLK